MRYTDQKWKIVCKDKEYIIACQCECGLRHDIQLDKKGNFIGRGTWFYKKDEK